MEKRHLIFIDWMKALGMLFIIMGHFFPPFLQYFTYSFSVQLFFFLSGFLFKPEQSIKPFLKKNFITLLLPYYIWGIIMLIPYNLRFGDLDILVSSLEGLLLGFHNFNGARGCGELWFVMTLFWIKLSVQILHKRPLGLYLFGIISIGLTFAYRSFIVGNPIEYWGISLGNVFVSFPFFFFGFLLSQYKQQVVSFSDYIKKYNPLILSSFCVGG